MLKPVGRITTRTIPDGVADRMTGLPDRVGVPGGGALTCVGSRQERAWRVPALLVGAAVACLAAFAVAMLPAHPAPSSSALSARHGLRSHPPTRLPISLADAASASIGASAHRYWPVRRGASLLTHGGGIRGTFTAAGAVLRVDQGTLGLSLAAVGRGRHLERVATVKPEPASNQILYRHGAISELFRNGPYGLEQGFSLRARPQPGTDPLVLAVGLRGSLRPERTGSQILFRTHSGATALHYGQLSALDATGRRLPAHMQLVNGTLRLQIDDSRARYPIRIDPFIQQGEKLTGTGESGKGLFGISVALSGDGKVALVGAESDNANIGAAWVFKREGSTWTQQGSKLTGGGEVEKAFFGSSVALSNDGSTALIGGESDNKNVGAVWVFHSSDFKTWTQQGAKLTGGGEKGEGEFGIGVALSSDGNTALIGGYGDGSGASKRTGAAWVFTRTSETWKQEAELTASNGTGAEVEFGTSVALTGDGKTALIGGRGDNANIGAAWVFTGSGSTWTQQVKLTGSGETGTGRFGESVALSREEGKTALIGGQGDNGEIGAAWVFAGSGSTWTQQAKLTGSGEVGSGRFGTGVALSGDGNMALIGADNDNLGIGAAFVFTRASEKWTQQGEKLTAGSGEIGSGGFGSSVALSADRHTALIGGSADNGSIGAAWVFTNPPIVVTGAASSVAPTSATLNATVNPNGVTVSDCHFEYGTTTSYGLTAPCTPSPGSGESPVAVSAPVTGLSEHTTYHFRISATNASGTSLGSDGTFGPPTLKAEPVSGVTQTSATLHATVNPNNVEVSDCKFEYGTNTKYESLPVSCTPSPGSGNSPVPVSAALSGLTANTTYHFRISATNAGGTEKGSDQTFTTLPNAPTVKTEPASAITQTSATLNAKVNPNGGEVTDCKFEYGTNTEYKSVPVSCTPPPGKGEVEVAVSASVTGLTAKTPYHFRISATNAGGTEKGSDQTFTTLPNAPTFEPCAGVAVTQTTATVCDKVNPNGGLVSDCKFEWGTNTKYESVPVSCATLPGSGESFEPVVQQITGLTANTLYHFRISATNPGGTSKGPDQEFKTLPKPPTLEPKPPSSITRSSATLNATVNPNGGEVKAGECNFEYGPTNGYGLSAPCTPSPITGEGPVAVSASLTGLSPNTTYHWRITAKNAGGESSSTDQTFATLLPNPPTFGTSFAAPNNLEGSFSEPDAVALDPSGNIWVADSGHNRVLEFNKERKFVRQFGSEGSGEAQFRGIQGIAANSAGDVYVTDSKNDRVQEFSPTGEFLRQFGSPGSGNGQFLFPNGIAVDSSGNVWVLDTFNYRVQEFSASGAFLSKFGSQGEANGQFGWASGLAFSGGNLYVADSSRVQEFSTAGTFIATFGSSGTGNGQFRGLGGIATDPTTGDLYVSDMANNRVQKFTAAGVFLSAVGTGGSGNGQFSAPRGVAVNSSGALYVADSGNNRVQEWLAGEPPTFATSFTPEKIEGGLKEPDAVAVDPSGNIWVADSGHNRVLEFNKERNFLRQFGVEAGEFKGIQGIATNSAGDVYVTASDHVQEFSPTGEFLRRWGSPGSGNGQFLFPNGIAVDSSGNVWVLDTFNSRVEEFSASGAFLSKFGSQGTGNGQLGWASGLAFAGGNLYVADSARVEEFSTAGTYLGQFGSSGTGNGQFRGLGDIASDPTTGNLYVSDIANNRVQEFSSSGAFIGFIAAFGTGGSGNGQFSSPRGVAVNASGTLYVADTGNNRVQEWVPSP